ncbi:hypothetical protein [Stackebrandtia albiflava]|nr:hypothetical protein [Stackebrandtia albiflava]
MDLEPFVERARRELALAADPDGRHRAVAERMASALAPTIRLTLLDALSAAADDITRELSPGAVEVRLRGGEPSFAVTPPPGAAAPDAETTEPGGTTVVPPDADDGPMTRINLRLSEGLKARIESAADTEGRSINAWLVRAASAVLEARGPGTARVVSGGRQRLTGWVR